VDNLNRFRISTLRNLIFTFSDMRFGRCAERHARAGSSRFSRFGGDRAQVSGGSGQRVSSRSNSVLTAKAAIAPSAAATTANCTRREASPAT
jgi:hypothetical protein